MIRFTTSALDRADAEARTWEGLNWCLFIGCALVLAAGFALGWSVSVNL